MTDQGKALQGNLPDQVLTAAQEALSSLEEALDAAESAGLSAAQTAEDTVTADAIKGLADAKAILDKTIGKFLP